MGQKAKILGAGWEEAEKCGLVGGKMYEIFVFFMSSLKEMNKNGVI